MINIYKKIISEYNKLKLNTKIKKEEKIENSNSKISELIRRRLNKISKEFNKNYLSDKEKYIFAKEKLKEYLDEIYAGENTISQITHRKIYLVNESKEIQSILIGIFGGTLLSTTLNICLGLHEKVMSISMSIVKEVNNPLRAIFASLTFVGLFAILEIIIFFLVINMFMRMLKDIYMPKLYEKLNIELYELRLIDESYKRLYGECVDYRYKEKKYKKKDLSRDRSRDGSRDRRQLCMCYDICENF